MADRITLPGLCPQTGKKCFYTEWREAAMIGRGNYTPEEVDELVYGYSQNIQCNEILEDEEGVFSSGCGAAFGIALQSIASYTRRSDRYLDNRGEV